MHTPFIAATMALLAATALPTGAAHAGQVAGHAPRGHLPRVTPNRPMPNRPMVHPGRPGVNLPGPRWGGKVQGRWYGGHYAPGGWSAYRAPVRGWIMPSYWVAPSFHIQDWSSYGLVQPQAGYGWYRYYDDAVLADRGGRVYDYRGGIDWDRGDNGRYVRDEGYYDRYEASRDAGVGYDYEGEGYPERRDDGVGGAVIGGVVGGVAGNVIAGRGNRLGGTVLGAGVGALAGTAIDRAEDRGRRAPPRVAPQGGYDGGGYGAGYPLPGDDVPVAPDDGYYDDRGGPDMVYAPPREQVQPTGRYRDTRGGPVRGGYVERRVAPGHVGQGGYSTTTTHVGGAYGAGGYVAGGYYYPPATVTTVTVASPVVTTTTVEEVVTYSTPRAATRRVVRRAPARSKTLCRCN